LLDIPPHSAARHTESAPKFCVLHIFFTVLRTGFHNVAPPKWNCYNYQPHRPNLISTRITKIGYVTKLATFILHKKLIYVTEFLFQYSTISYVSFIIATVKDRRNCQVRHRLNFNRISMKFRLHIPSFGAHRTMYRHVTG